MDIEQDFDKRKLDSELVDIKNRLRDQDYSIDQLIDYCALLIINEATQDMHIKGLIELIDDHEKITATFESFLKTHQKQDIEFHESVIKYQNAVDKYKKSVPLIVKNEIKKEASRRGKTSADKGHAQKGGSRDKQSKMREIFATGKYKNNRDKCALSEWENVGMAYSTARKALIGTPDPT